MTIPPVRQASMKCTRDLDNAMNQMAQEARIATAVNSLKSNLFGASVAQDNNNVISDSLAPSFSH